MTARKRRPAAGSVLLSRPRRPGRVESALSSRVGRTTIRRHHALQKRLSQAKACNDQAAADTVRAEIEQNGGLERYQQASVCGQSSQRGGDSSKLLVQWIREARLGGAADGAQGDAKLRVLEVGCLSPENAVSKSALFDVTRIDLHSRHPSIESQDFMQRPLPTDAGEKFDIVSLSLVLNYVPLPAARGHMLQRTTQFLREASHPLLPALFLVLPAPCVHNSRYLDEERLAAIMASLGYRLEQTKTTAKLYYGLWRLSGVGALSRQPERTFKKVEVKSGRIRNNFAIVLE